MPKGKCAVITGSTGGQGNGVAAALAEQGCNIVLNGLGDTKQIERQRAELASRRGVTVSYHPADLAVESEVVDLVLHAERQHGAVHILTNNAVVRHSEPVDRSNQSTGIRNLRKIYRRHSSRFARLFRECDARAGAGPSTFNPDRSVKTDEDTARCFSCRTGQEKQDFVSSGDWMQSHR